MPAPPDPLDRLMAQLADGDRSVFRAVFERLWPPIERLCTRLLQNPADAADAAQEALQKILERAPADYDRTRPALPWALAIAGWECRTLARKRQRRRESPAQLEEQGPRDPEDVEQQFAQRELSRAALEALGELSDVDRETLIATFWEEAEAQGPAAAQPAAAQPAAAQPAAAQPAAAQPAAAQPAAATVRKRRERALGRLRIAFRRLYGLD
jgi:RNA polymerase sigma-70 factor (ECF subfamily)